MQHATGINKALGHGWKTEFILLFYFITVFQKAHVSEPCVGFPVLRFPGQKAFHCVAQADLKLLNSSNPPASDSQIVTLV